MARRLWYHARLSLLIAAASVLSSCFPSGTALSDPTPTGSVGATAQPTWTTLAPGLEQRTYRPGGDYPLTQFTALRIDPALYTFRPHYRPGAPLSLNGWQAALPDAHALINANFFDPQNRALGLLVVDGAVFGQPYVGRGGLLQVQAGEVRVRSTILEPYIPGEPLAQAVQAFPMLVTNNQASYTNRRGDFPSRRTIAGQDSSGRIVLMATNSLIGMSLVDLSAYLPTTDLDLVNAVNLDGGGSTMMGISVPGRAPLTIPAFDPVPVVLAVYPR
ncbi:MAG: phosphodiester glycosidase family protein [Chloroflexi bacterium]|nr:phosphodiester glycosidase family protein [Chloroflexota bacterium]